MDFICAGIDLKTIPSPDLKSVDDHLWPTHEVAYQYVRKILSVKENYMQLLSIESPHQFDSILRYSSSVRNFSIISVYIGIKTINAFSPAHPIQRIPDSKSWKFLNYDVCDIDGFFSIFGMSPTFTKDLSSENQLVSAFEISEKANISFPDHRPFVVVKLCEWRSEC